MLRPALGHLRAIDVTTDVVQAWQRRWQEQGTSNATCNRRGNVLRRAFRLGQRAGKVHVAPFVPRLKEQSRRGRYLSGTDAATLDEHLPPYLKPVFSFAYVNATRKGQLCRTLRRYVDLERGVVSWPPDECKHGEPHTLPLEGASLELVASLMKRPPLWCPYLFHSPRCAPGHRPSKAYGCIGDFKRAFSTALKAAGLPAGRKHGGYTFHHTRNTAATNLRAEGMSTADIMDIGGWRTAEMVRRYDLKDVEALKRRLAAARTAKPTPLHSVSR